jgi:hypothetical protein
MLSRVFLETTETCHPAPVPPPTFSVHPDTTWPRHAPKRQSDTGDTPARPRAASPAARASYRKACKAASHRLGRRPCEPSGGATRPPRRDRGDQPPTGRRYGTTHLPLLNRASTYVRTACMIERTISRISSDYRWPVAAGLAFLSACLCCDCSCVCPHVCVAVFARVRLFCPLESLIPY